MAEQLLAFVYARAHFLSTDYIITIDQLQALANESLCSNNNNNNNQQQRQPPLSSEDLSILVHHLIKTGAAKCRYSDEKQKYTLVKFRIPSTTSSSHHEQRISDITETDLGIINLKHTISIIHGQVDLLKSTIAG